MKIEKLLKHIIMVFVTVLILISSTGFNIYHYYCKTDKTISHTLFVNKCNSTEIHHHENQSKSPKCCSDDYDNLCNNLYEENECCEMSMTYHKIEIQNILEKSFKHFKLTTTDIHLFSSLFNFSDFKESSKNVINKELPPLLGGKALIFFIKKIKIPDLLF